MPSGSSGGGGGGTGVRDDVPDPSAFTAATGAPRGHTVESNAITETGRRVYLMR